MAARRAKPRRGMNVPTIRKIEKNRNQLHEDKVPAKYHFELYLCI